MLFTVAIEDTVFLRSPPLFGEGIGGEVTVSFGVEVFLDSQENGLVNFLVAAGAGGGGWEPWCGCGGGAHGTDGSTPDSPCREGFVFLGGGVGFEFSTNNGVS